MRVCALKTLGALAGLATVLGQSSTSSSLGDAAASSFASVATTITGGVVSTAATAASTTSSVDVPRPTANLTTGATQDLRLWAPESGLTMCERVTFAFTGPSVPKTCGVYVTNTSTYIQQIPLGGTYTSLTAGTFSWLVDLPAGLSVVSTGVTLNGAVTQYSLPAIIVQPSSDNSCLGTGQGQNTQSIISYASALNESYTWTPPSATSTSKGSTPNVGAIAGGTIGGVALLLALALGLYVLRTRHRARSAPPPPPGLELGEDAKAWDYAARGGLSYAQMVAMSYNGSAATAAAPYQAQQQPSGFAAEPMPATPPPTTPGSHSHSHGRTALSPAPGGTSELSGPTATPSTGTGTTGLDDPASFVSRSQRG
ncbi:hypothetical protein DMC30DRAFT_423629 [Rhodotorula diobovata]|uniref:Uncharacterized protein n=1 Tax=Rhodotorula diobovata TaxID=5288 RepID=A0A5C5G391_9BASI|nr:hypothetical protein DMC30DRAFT_423629 [Rhodotorula diobovata]